MKNEFAPYELALKLKKRCDEFDIKMRKFIDDDAMVEIFTNEKGLLDVRESNEPPLTEYELKEIEVYWEYMEYQPLGISKERYILQRMLKYNRTRCC
jgi:hypothetical protein